MTGISSFINRHSIISECQVPTQRYGRRPFGVGFLMAGYDVSLSLMTMKNDRELMELNRKKAHIYTNYVHQRIIIRANQWRLVLDLNQLELIWKRI